MEVPFNKGFTVPWQLSLKRAPKSQESSKSYFQVISARMEKEESSSGFLSIPKTFVPFVHFNWNFSASQGVVRLYHWKNNCQWVHVLRFMEEWVRAILKGSFMLALLHPKLLVAIWWVIHLQHVSPSLRPHRRWAKFSRKLPDDRPDDLREFKQTRFWATHVNRKWAFCNIRQWFANIFGQVVSIRARKISITNWAASRYIKKENASLQPLLKLYSQLWTTLNKSTGPHSQIKYDIITRQIFRLVLLISRRLLKEKHTLCLRDSSTLTNFHPPTRHYSAPPHPRGAFLSCPLDCKTTWVSN